VIIILYLDGEDKKTILMGEKAENIMEEQTQYHVMLLAKEKMEENIFHRVATDGTGGLPTKHGNPDGFRMYRDSKFNTLTVAALDEEVAKTFYNRLKECMPDAYLVPPTKYTYKN
jgi:hypothetical protein